MGAPGSSAPQAPDRALPVGTPYLPSGKVSPGGVLVLFGLGGALAWLVGVVCGLFTDFIWDFWVFPLVCAFGTAFAAIVGIRAGKCRNQAVAAAAALWCVACTYGEIHRLKNDAYRSDLRATLIKDKQATPETAEAVSHAKILAEAGSDDFGSLVRRRARRGLQATSRRSKDGKWTVLSGWGAYLYWIVETGLGALLALFLAVNFAREPFCEACGRWYEKLEGWGIRPEKQDALGRALAGKDFAGIHKLVEDRPGAKDLKIEECPRCPEGPLAVSFELPRPSWKGLRATTAFQEFLQREDAQRLRTTLPGLRKQAKPPV